MFYLLHITVFYYYIILFEKSKNVGKKKVAVLFGRGFLYLVKSIKSLYHNTSVFMNTDSLSNQETILEL